MRGLSAVLVLCVAMAAPVHASVLDAQVRGDTYTATVSLPGGIGADLIVRFENVVGLDVSSLGVSVEQVSPTSAGLLARMPSTLVSVPAAFPVLIRIEPNAGSGFAFEGVVEVELYTRNLHYTVGTPLRLYSAPSGGAFRDITDRVSGGSYRPRGSSGHFSDFLIVADLRTPSTVISDKFARLGADLQALGPSISPAVRAQIDQLFAVAQSHWSGGSPAAAADAIAAFETAVADAAASGQMPRVWRASGDIQNVEGTLRAGARTLRFSLNQASNQL